MSKPVVRNRYPWMQSFFTTHEMADAITRAAEQDFMSKSQFLRMATLRALKASGVTVERRPTRPTSAPVAQAQAA
jgi:hypothetical protein